MTCDGLEVPLNNLAGTSVIGTAPLTEAGACHDSGVILGSVNKMVCASHDHANVFDIGDNEIPGGSLTSPQFLFTISEPGVCNEPGNPLCNGNWHSAAFTWDGEVIILGWEPGGGSQAECEATDPDVKKSWFFYDADTGAKLGQFVLPRPQGATYWYNGRIYESDITRGLLTSRLNDPAVTSYFRTPHPNPQTQKFSID
jgi:hypothetical protein